MGRILAIADAYSAMTLGRPYRESLTPEQAGDPAGSEAQAG